MASDFFGTRALRTDRETVWKRMQEKGVGKIVAHFSGGNDEGGVNTYTMYDLEGKRITAPDDVKKEATYARDIYPFTRAEFFGHEDYWPKQGSLAWLVEQPVDMEYGSFAGDFSVSGECVWDAATKKVSMRGEESAGYASFDREF